MRRFTFITFVIAIISGCAWVKPSADASQVQVLNHQQAEQCQQIARTTVSVLDNIVFIPRSEQQVAEELKTLARNSAAEVQGNCVVPISKVIDGEQIYNIYNCKVKHVQ